MLVAFIIWSVLFVLFVALGVYTRRSKKPVGFWANAKAPEIKDVKAYNKALSKIWFVFAVLFELMGLPLLAGNSDGALILVPELGTVFLVIGTMFAYTFVENKYRK